MESERNTIETIDTNRSISKNAEDDETEIISEDMIKSLIYVFRGKQVMLDSDLAMMYQVETKTFNQTVKRNIKRFPEDFRFQLTKEEYEVLRSQFVTSKGSGGRRYLPYVFTEAGIAMLSAVLRSDIAIRVSIRIMNAFVEMRHFLANNSLILNRLNEIELNQLEYQKNTDEKFEKIFDYISDHEEDNQKIFYDGQIFDAFSLITELVQQAEKTIILIDGYVDVMTLNIMAKKKEGVGVTFYTLPSAKLTAQDIAKFNEQYPTLDVMRTTAFHDRFLIVDGMVGYHIGASIKDAGKKCFGINRIEDVGVVHDLIQRAELTS